MAATLSSESLALSSAFRAEVVWRYNNSPATTSGSTSSSSNCSTCVSQKFSNSGLAVLDLSLCQTILVSTITTCLGTDFRLIVAIVPMISDGLVSVHRDHSMGKPTGQM